jgi:tRNA threonylcarbamoyladenosine biosynthesis protein TsaB
MALILSLETATKVCSVALHDKGVLLAEMNVMEEYSHFEKLPTLIEQVLKESNRKFSDLKCIAVSMGPGSYTGLRIGVSMAKGIAFSLNIPIVSVNTLKGLAVSAMEKAGEKELLCPMIDARRSEVYTMIVNHHLEEIWPTQALIIDKHSFNEVIENHNLLVFGDGSNKFISLFESFTKIRFNELSPSAKQIGELGWKKFQNAEFENTAYFEPYYLKDFRPGIGKKKLTL